MIRISEICFIALLTNSRFFADSQASFSPKALVTDGPTAVEIKGIENTDFVASTISIPSIQPFIANSAFESSIDQEEIPDTIQESQPVAVKPLENSAASVGLVEHRESDSSTVADESDHAVDDFKLQENASLLFSESFSETQDNDELYNKAQLKEKLPYDGLSTNNEGKLQVSSSEANQVTQNVGDGFDLNGETLEVKTSAVPVADIVSPASDTENVAESIEDNDKVTLLERVDSEVVGPISQGNIQDFRGSVPPLSTERVSSDISTISEQNDAKTDSSLSPAEGESLASEVSLGGEARNFLSASPREPEIRGPDVFSDLFSEERLANLKSDDQALRPRVKRSVSLEGEQSYVGQGASKYRLQSVTDGKVVKSQASPAPPAAQPAATSGSGAPKKGSGEQSAPPTAQGGTKQSAPPTAEESTKQQDQVAVDSSGKEEVPVVLTPGLLGGSPPTQDQTNQPAGDSQAGNGSGVDGNVKDQPNAEGGSGAGGSGSVPADAGTIVGGGTTGGADSNKLVSDASKEGDQSVSSEKTTQPVSNVTSFCTSLTLNVVLFVSALALLSQS